MRALVIYESMWGNTARVARAIADGLSQGLAAAPGTESGLVETLEVGEAPRSLPEELDLLVVGGPTHAFSLSRHATRADALEQGATRATADPGLREWLEGLGYGPHQARVATFDTGVAKVRHLPGSAARKAMRMLRERGFDSAAHPRSFFVADLAGPVLDGELDQATEFGRALGAHQLAHRG